MKSNGRDVLVGITSWGEGPESDDNTFFDDSPFLDGKVRTGSVCSFIQSTSGVPPGIYDIDIYL